MALKLNQYEVQIQLIEDMLGTVPKDKETYRRFIAEKLRKDMEKRLAKAQKTNDVVYLADGTTATIESIEQKMEEEVETIVEAEEKGWTGFHQDHDGPFIFEYMIKGHLKHAAGVLKEGEGEGEATIKQLKDKISKWVWVKAPLSEEMRSMDELRVIKLRRRIRLPKPGRIENFDKLENPMIVQDPVTGMIRCERPLRAMTMQGPRVTVVRSDVVLAGAKLDYEITILPGLFMPFELLENILEIGQYEGLGQWRSGGWGRFRVLKLKKLVA